MSHAVDTQYFFIRRLRGDDRIPALRADDVTSMRAYAHQSQPPGAPLVFLNAWRKENRKKKIKELVGGLLFEGNRLLVRGSVRTALLRHDIAHLEFNPAVYIDDRDTRHEDYWFLTFTQEFDCWDRAASDYLDDPIEMGNTRLYEVDRYRLNQSLMLATPLRERLLFKMGGTTDGFVTVHESLLPAFEGETGAQFQGITAY